MQTTKTTGWPKERVARLETLPTDPQEATWECPTCGVIEPYGYDVKGVIHYGRVSVCDCQIKEKQRKEEEQRRQQWLESCSKTTYGWLGTRWDNIGLRKKTFDNFVAERQPEAYEFARLFSNKPNGTFVLYGSFGTGKTHLLSAVCNESLGKHKITSLFALAPDLFASIQYRIGRNEDYSDLVDKAARTPLLVLDDIDKAKWTEFREEIYLSIIDKRVTRGLPTAISTNRLDALASFVGGAVCSRLQVGQIAIEMVGNDFRKEL